MTQEKPLISKEELKEACGQEMQTAVFVWNSLSND